MSIHRHIGGNMDCLKLLVVLLVSAAAVTGFQLRSSLGKFKILPLGVLFGTVYKAA